MTEPLKIITDADIEGFAHADGLQALIRKMILDEKDLPTVSKIFLNTLRVSRPEDAMSDELLAVHAVFIEAMAMRKEGLIE